MNIKKTLLISGGALTTLIIVLLIITLINPPTYNEILVRSESLIQQQVSANITYAVNYQNTNGLELNGLATYELSNGTIKWNNNLTIIEGTFFDIQPTEIIELMKLGEINAVEDYQSNQPCYLLNSFYTADVPGVTGNNNLVRILACLNKTHGFPDQYVVLIGGSTNALLVSYNALLITLREPKPFNESDISIEINETQ